MSKTSKQTIQDRIDELVAPTYARYSQRYDNVVYLRATAGKPSDLCNQLLNDAMCLCGSPYYAYSHQEWDADASAFLTLFC